MITADRLPVTSNDLANTFHLRTLYIGPRASAPNPTVGAYMTLPITHAKMTFAQLRAIAMSVLQHKQITGSGPMAKLLTTENVPLFNKIVRRLKLGYAAQHPFRNMPAAWVGQDPVIMFSVGASDATPVDYNVADDYIVDPPYVAAGLPYDRVGLRAVYLGPRSRADRVVATEGCGYVTLAIPNRRYSHAMIRMDLLSALAWGHVEGTGRVPEIMRQVASLGPVKRGVVPKPERAVRHLIDVIKRLRMGTAQYPLNMLDPGCPDPVLVVEFMPLVQ